MKKRFCSLIIIVLSVMITFPVLAQNVQREAELFDPSQEDSVMTVVRKKMLSKLRVGMSQSQVRQILGNPKRIEAGAPEKDEDIILMPPGWFSGKLVYSSWFYPNSSKRKMVCRIEPYEKTTVYRVNGLNASKEQYDEFTRCGSAYIMPGRAMLHDSKGMAELDISIRKKVIVEPIDAATTTVKEIPAKYMQVIYTPWLYVVFEKSSNLVCGAKLYFLRISEAEIDDRGTAGMVGSKFKATK